MRWYKIYKIYLFIIILEYLFTHIKYQETIILISIIAKKCDQYSYSVTFNDNISYYNASLHLFFDMF